MLVPSFPTSIFLTSFIFTTTMVKLTTVTAANSAFIKRQPFTAVFVGATNGIGEFTVRELCKTHGQDGPGLRIIMVGRNEKAAQTIIEECKAVCSTTEIHFVQAGDISLLRGVDKACSEIQELLELAKAPGIDILIQSQGRVQFEGRVGKSSLFRSG
jgi:NAD(P)-dependent dehydrogenase (short-subunit alcohol dehydrogenase family)